LIQLALLFRRIRDMPVIKSAIKQMRQAEAARKKNREVKASFRNKVKAVQKDLEAGGQNASKLASEAFSAIDKAAKKNIIHKKTAARRKSRLVLSINKSLGKTVELKSDRTKTATVVKPKKITTKSAKPKTTKKPTKKTS